MDVTNITALIGAVSGIVSLMGILYLAGFKWGKLETQVNLMWKINVEDALREQRKLGFVSAQSPWQPTEKFWELHKDKMEKATLDKFRVIALTSKSKTPDEIVKQIVKALGWMKINERSMQMDITIKQFLANAVAVINSLAEKDINGR